MGVNSLPQIVTRQRRDCDLNPGPSAPESSTLTTRLPTHPLSVVRKNVQFFGPPCRMRAASIIGGSSPSCWERQASYVGSGAKLDVPKPEAKRVDSGVGFLGMEKLAPSPLAVYIGSLGKHCKCSVGLERYKNVRTDFEVGLPCGLGLARPRNPGSGSPTLGKGQRLRTFFGTHTRASVVRGGAWPLKGFRVF